MSTTNKVAPDLMTLLGIGVLWGACLGAGLFGGVLADSRWKTSPLLVICGVGIAIVVAAVGTYQVIRPYLDRSPSDPHPPTRPESDQRG